MLRVYIYPDLKLEAVDGNRWKKKSYNNYQQPTVGPSKDIVDLSHGWSGRANKHGCVGYVYNPEKYGQLPCKSRDCPPGIDTRPRSLLPSTIPWTSNTYIFATLVM